MPDERDSNLAKAFETKQPTYNGWLFEYMYPGYFSFSKGNKIVFFTPDFNGEGEISPQVQDQDGNHFDGYDELPQFQPVRYSNPLTFEQMFSHAKGMMDHIDSINGTV